MARFGDGLPHFKFWFWVTALSVFLFGFGSVIASMFYLWAIYFSFAMFIPPIIFSIAVYWYEGKGE